MVGKWVEEKERNERERKYIGMLEYLTESMDSWAFEKLGVGALKLLGPHTLDLLVCSAPL